MHSTPDVIASSSGAHRAASCHSSSCQHITAFRVFKKKYPRHVQELIVGVAPLHGRAVPTGPMPRSYGAPKTARQGQLSHLGCWLSSFKALSASRSPQSPPSAMKSAPHGACLCSPIPVGPLWPTSTTELPAGASWQADTVRSLEFSKLMQLYIL